MLLSDSVFVPFVIIINQGISFLVYTIFKVFNFKYFLGNFALYLDGEKNKIIDHSCNTNDFKFVEFNANGATKPIENEHKCRYKTF